MDHACLIGRCDARARARKDNFGSSVSLEISDSEFLRARYGKDKSREKADVEMYMSFSPLGDAHREISGATRSTRLSAPAASSILSRGDCSSRLLRFRGSGRHGAIAIMPLREPGETSEASLKAASEQPRPCLGPRHQHLSGLAGNLPGGDR